MVCGYTYVHITYLHTTNSWAYNFVYALRYWTYDVSSYIEWTDVTHTRAFHDDDNDVMDVFRINRKERTYYEIMYNTNSN